MTTPTPSIIPAPAEEAQQLDWFVGNWAVQCRMLTEAGWVEDTCASRVEKTLDGHALLERFWGQVGGDYVNGISIRVYHPGEKRWEQAWVDNNSQRVTVYYGHFAEGSFVGRNRASLEDPTTTRHARETFWNITPTQFDWRLDVSEDKETWKTVWELKYTRQ